jgi:hypothetical protein
MRVDHEFILAQRRDSRRPPQWSQFACHVRNLTGRALSLTVPFYILENMPQMSDAEHRALLQRNRERVSSRDGDGEVPAEANPDPRAADPIELLAGAHQALATAMQRGDLQEIHKLKETIAVIEEYVSALRRSASPKGPAAERPQQEKPTPKPPSSEEKNATAGASPPTQQSGGQTEGATDWR